MTYKQYLTEFYRLRDKREARKHQAWAEFHLECESLTRTCDDTDKRDAGIHQAWADFYLESEALARAFNNTDKPFYRRLVELLKGHRP